MPSLRAKPKRKLGAANRWGLLVDAANGLFARAVCQTRIQEAPPSPIQIAANNWDLTPINCPCGRTTCRIVGFNPSRSTGYTHANHTTNEYHAAQ